LRSRGDDVEYLALVLNASGENRAPEHQQQVSTLLYL
jgi:hypothetical protein